MSNPQLDHSALKECLETLNHLFIDIVRLTYEQGYEEIVGGYCELKVATLDSGKPTSKLVAAKKLRLGIRALEPKRLAFRLARELKVWAGLRHPHVLPLLGFHLGNDYKTALLISEYMKHGDLKDFIAKTKPSCNERLYLVRDITDGLAYLHTQSAPIRHGDLKPGNVLVNSDRRALLADFGLSKALDTGPTGFTMGNDARGTVRYSSPEVLLEGTAAISLPNDIWSWGCLVVEVLADEIPFAGIKLEPKLIIALVQGKSPCDTASLSSYAKELKVLLDNCWSPQPSQRPTAVDCLRTVESALPRLAADTCRKSSPVDFAALEDFLKTLNHRYQAMESQADSHFYRHQGMGGTLSQIARQTPQVGHTQDATQQQKAIMQNQPRVAFPPQPSSSGQRRPKATGRPHSVPLPRRLFDTPEITKLGPDELKRSGYSDDSIQRLMAYRQSRITKTVQNRREQKLLSQQGQIHAQPAHQAAKQGAGLFSPQKETPQLAPGNHYSASIGSANSYSAVSAAVAAAVYSSTSSSSSKQQFHQQQAAGYFPNGTPVGSTASSLGLHYPSALSSFNTSSVSPPVSPPPPPTSSYIYDSYSSAYTNDNATGAPPFQAPQLYNPNHPSAASNAPITSLSHRSSAGLMSSRPDPLTLNRMLAAVKPKQYLDEEAVVINGYGDLDFDAMNMSPVQDVGLFDDQRPVTPTAATWCGATPATDGYDMTAASSFQHPSYMGLPIPSHTSSSTYYTPTAAANTYLIPPPPTRQNSILPYPASSVYGTYQFADQQQQQYYQHPGMMRATTMYEPSATSFHGALGGEQ